MMPSESEEKRSGPGAGAAEAQDIEALKQALAEEKARAERYLANWQRAQADFVNFKRYCEQEKEQLYKLANASVIECLLPVLDDMERAFHSLPPESGAWTEGFKLIDRKLHTILEAQGLCPIEAMGKPFDPRFHEAVRQEKGKEGEVIGEVQKGYMLKDRVIRPSKVIVGSGEEGTETEKEK